jgi:hypothetical protein
MKILLEFIAILLIWYAIGIENHKPRENKGLIDYLFSFYTLLQVALITMSILIIKNIR